ncbi:hypothetical protein BaRGS_00007001 [Batillaria attramentaria]|uniref:Beta-lactamase-related domain-containing protein n=1 Tax=Batillaria attramentaria TaxID=370345 RepID=A0ABD0LQQ3_9CAEN
MAAYPFTLQSPRLKTWCLFSLVTFSVFVTLHAFDVIAVDDAIRAAQACRAHTNPGLSVSVVQDGRTLLSRGYGVRRGDDPADSSTGFTIASLTKAFTAALLLKVMEDDGRWVNFVAAVSLPLGSLSC